MKKLQSLENFKNSGLSLQSMSKLNGGENPNATPAGYTTTSTERSSTGCMSFTSDETVAGGINYTGCTDVKTGNCN